MLQKNSIILAADLETTKATKNKNAQVYAWAFCVLTKYDKWNKRHRYLFDHNLIKKLKNQNYINKKYKDKLTYYYGYRIKDFVKILRTVSTSITLLFQNGNHFDVHFVIDELNKQGLVRVLPFLDYSLKNQVISSNFQLYIRWYVNELEKRKNANKLFKVFNDNSIHYKIKEKLLNTLSINEYKALEVNHDFFQVKICVNKDTKHKNKHIFITILDPWLQFNASLAIKGQEINLPKLEIEYDKITLYNSIIEFENDGNQLKYLLRDVEILYKHTLKMYSFIGFNNVQITAAAIAYRQFLIFFRKAYFNKLIKNKRITFLGLKQEKGKQNIYQWRINDLGLRKFYKSKILTKKIFFQHIWKHELVKDTLTEEEREHLFNHYYRGGICHVNEKYRGVITTAVGYDINSSYPNVMQSNELCPIGAQLFINVSLFDKKYYCFIRIQSLKDIYLKEFMPFLRNTENRSESVTAFVNNQYKYHTFYYKYSYCKQINRTDIYYLSSTELWHLCDILKITTEKQLQKYFVFKTEYVFKATTFSYYFKDFINFWYKIKKTKPNQKSIAKLILNSCYGKFAQRKINVLKFDYQLENGDIKILTKIYRELNAYYLPLGIAIPAQARINLCKVVDYNYDNFVYADTDSAYFTVPKKHIPQHENKIGYWKNEGVFTNFMARRPKQYIAVNYKTKEAKLTVSGIRFNDELRYYNIKGKNQLNKNFNYFTKYLGFEKFLEGYILKNQHLARKFNKGVDIYQYDKQLKPTWSTDISIEAEQFRRTKKDYRLQLLIARHLDLIFNLPSQNNYLKITPDLKGLDKLCFEPTQE